MKNLLLLLLVPSLFIAMELPVAPLSPRSHELAKQRAIMKVNRAEQHVFQEESTRWIADLESDVSELQQELKKVHAESAPSLAPQIEAVKSVLKSHATLIDLHDQEIVSIGNSQQLQTLLLTQKLESLRKTQQEQIQLQAKQVDLQQRISAAERSNYYLKWALGITTAVTTTAFSIMGYLLWKNQQAIHDGNKIIVDRNHKGAVISFSQNRSDALQIAIPQPGLSPAQAPVTPMPSPAQTPSAQNLHATNDEGKYVTPEQLEEVRASIPQIRRVIDNEGKHFLEFTDQGHKPRTGHSSYAPEFWPPKGFTENLK
ncbi:MAG: hypothetical protein AMXMBFR12_07240 [Candidatus Babeliales bacterium]